MNDKLNPEFADLALKNARYFSSIKGKAAAGISRQWYRIAAMYGGANA